MKILVIRFSSAGDIILTSPFLRALRSRFPDATVHYAIKEEFAPLVRHSPHVDRLIELATGSGFGALMRLKSSLIAEVDGAYDIVFDLHDSLRSRHLRFGLGRELSVIRKPALAKWLLVNRKVDRMSPPVPIPLRYLQTGAAFGIADDGGGLELHLGNTLSPIVATLDRLTIAIAPGARHFTKRWPVDRYRALAHMLAREHNARIILLGGADDRTDCATIADGLTDVINLAGRVSMLESAAACESCDVVVTNDSAMSHVAAARRRPVVAIFGSSVQQFGFAPFRTESTVAENQGLYCRPCSSIGRSMCPEGHFRCMLEIAPETVLESVMRHARAHAS